MSKQNTDELAIMIGGAIYEAQAQIAQDDERTGTLTLHADRYRCLGQAALDAMGAGGDATPARKQSAYFPAMNSIVASRWTILCARLFGRHREFRDGATWVKVAEWRGKTYLINGSD